MVDISSPFPARNCQERYYDHKKDFEAFFIRQHEAELMWTDITLSFISSIIIMNVSQHVISSRTYFSQKWAYSFIIIEYLRVN